MRRDFLFLGATSPRRADRRARPPARGANLQREERDPRTSKGERLDGPVQLFLSLDCGPPRRGAGQAPPAASAKRGGRGAPRGDVLRGPGPRPGTATLRSKVYCVILYTAKNEERRVRLVAALPIVRVEKVEKPLLCEV